LCLFNGENAECFLLSSKASDTSVTCAVTVVDAIASDVVRYLGTGLTEAGGAGRLSAAISAYGNVATPVFTAACVNQTGDSYTKTSGLTAQETRDALKLAPTAGTPATGSIDKLLDDVPTAAENLSTWLADASVIELLSRQIGQLTVSGTDKNIYTFYTKADTGKTTPVLVVTYNHTAGTRTTSG
jgi:hypothetical protein